MATAATVTCARSTIIIIARDREECACIYRVSCVFVYTMYICTLTARDLWICGASALLERTALLVSRDACLNGIALAKPCNGTLRVLHDHITV